MKYCLNIINILDKNFRLQKDKSWTICLNPAIISNNDFVSESTDEIKNLQIKNIEVFINNEKYEIELDLDFSFGNCNQLSYSVYGFRDNYPSPPQIEQLKQTLLNGDDSRYNCLVLLIDGNFKLFNETEIGSLINPEIVIQHLGFFAGNELVGPQLNDMIDFDIFVNELFGTSIYYWKEHLLTKKIHFQADDIFVSNIDALLNLFSDLENIKKNWTKYTV